MKAKPIPRKVREAVYERDEYRCQRCGISIQGYGSVHHRRARGMGGSSQDPHTPDNLVLLCGSGVTGCHGKTEANRATAYAEGWLVQRGHAPGSVPVLRFGRTWSWLDEAWRPCSAGVR